MHRMINLATCIIKKYRLRYDQSVTCLFHSVKFFALTVQSTLLVTLREIYHKRRNSNKQSHHKSNKRSTTQTQKVLATKQKALKCKGVDVLEGDRWNVNSRESTDKEFPIKDYD